VQADVVDPVDDEAADNADAHRQECNENSESDVPEDDPGPRLPNKVQNRRNVLERANAVAPGVAGTLRTIGLLFTGLAGGHRVTHGWGHAPLSVPPGSLVSGK
jgi:hypothetical protein